MRKPIFVKAERFDLESVMPHIEAVRDDFDRYLNDYPVKSSRSKHSLMGPVGKILQEVRTGKWDAESLCGYALNIHLANPRTKGFIGADARAALKEGVGKLIDLLAHVPVTAHDRVIDRIDYGLYFVRRSKGLQWLEEVRQDFVLFLRDKYGTGEQLAKVWGGKPADYGSDFGRVKYPSLSQFEEATGQRKVDMSEFANRAELKGYELPEEVE